MRRALALLLLALLTLALPAQAVVRQPTSAGGITALPTVYYYPYQAETTTTGAGGAFDHLVRWLANDLPGKTGPGWPVVELAQDAGWGAGSPCPNDRTALVNANDLDSCGAYAPAVNDWAIFSSKAGMYGTTFNLYLELQSTTVIYVLLFPMGAHTAAPGAFVSPPAYDTPSVGAGSATPVSLTTVNGAFRMSAIADTAMLQLLSDNAGTRYWLYVGELNGAKSGGTPADDRPFVISDTPTNYRCGGSADFNRVSPVDDATVLTSGWIAAWFNSTAGTSAIRESANGGDATLLAQDIMWPAGISFTDAGSTHGAGFLRQCLCYNRNAGSLVQTAALDWVGAASSATGGGIALRWDSATAYTGATALVPARGGVVAVPRDRISSGMGW